LDRLQARLHSAKTDLEDLVLQQAPLVVGYLVAVRPLQGPQEASLALVAPITITMLLVEVFSARHPSLLLVLAMPEAVVCLEVEVQEAPLAQRTIKAPVLLANPTVQHSAELLVNARAAEVRLSPHGQRRRAPPGT